MYKKLILSAVLLSFVPLSTAHADSSIPDSTNSYWNTNRTVQLTKDIKTNHEIITKGTTVTLKHYVNNTNMFVVTNPIEPQPFITTFNQTVPATVLDTNSFTKPNYQTTKNHTYQQLRKWHYEFDQDNTKLIVFKNKNQFFKYDQLLLAGQHQSEADQFAKQYAKKFKSQPTKVLTKLTKRYKLIKINHRIYYSVIYNRFDTYNTYSHEDGTIYSKYGPHSKHIIVNQPIYVYQNLHWVTPKQTWVYTNQKWLPILKTISHQSKKS